ncbi:hypothetical protein EI77_02678 [Prosthecobacter fusiformis]|uniref:Uncharacterized protein n=1 Tax=Prosthecobacter fusiformis TaxID=48464 RepID=A0A4R7RXP6_9BACT|nr:hypothetical protein [Prosthecobacter fusiformis]TDU70630.1 hypothetical protein EI77_02678 [Prosthecobacter fusiformis]
MKKERLLTFDWHTHDSSILRMGFALLVTLGAIVSLFIVFRVVTPESRQVDVRPQRVMLLNPSVPAERALIHLAMDRSFGLLPSESSVTGPLQVLKMPAFTPSYARHELRLKPLPSGLAASTHTRPFALDMDVLPPLPDPVTTPRAAPAPSVLQAVVQGPVAARAPKMRAIKNVPLADMNRPRFQVAVGSLGQVLLALPLNASEDAAINQKLHAAVTQLHFTPAESEIEWGQVSFEWVNGEAAP